MENKIRDLLDKGLSLMSDKSIEPIIKEAMDIFKSPFSGQNIDVDFNNEFSDWFLNDYKHDNKSLYEMNDINSPEQISIENSFLSIFKVSDEKNKIVIKDVFTQLDYIVKTTEVCNPGDLIKARLYPNGNDFLIINEPTYYDSQYESTVRKSVMYQYNSYCAVNGPTSIEEFVKIQSLMIYHLSTLIEYYEGVLEDDESLYVYIAKYKVTDKDLVLDVLLDQDDFQLVEHNEYETLINHIIGDKIMAEILVDEKWIEIECISETDLMLTRERLDIILEDKVVFVNESRLGLADLLN